MSEARKIDRKDRKIERTKWLVPIERALHCLYKNIFYTVKGKTSIGRNKRKLFFFFLKSRSTTYLFKIVKQNA